VLSRKEILESSWVEKSSLFVIRQGLGGNVCLRRSDGV
jgi:hypothetical protein